MRTGKSKKEESALQDFLSIVPSSTREDARRILIQADHDVNRAVNFFLNVAEGSNAATERLKAEPKVETKTKTAELSSIRSEHAPTVPPVWAGGIGGEDRTVEGAKAFGEAVHSVVESSFFQPRPSQLWQDTVNNCREIGEKFTDPEFIPGPSSIDGREVNEKLGSSTFLCGCGINASLKTVRKDGPNQGKLFYTCSKRKCKFFKWTSNIAPHTRQALDLTWKRFDGPEYVPCKGAEEFESSDVLQGAVGDCWFLSGLAVIAEQKRLIQRIFPVVQEHFEGVYEVRLFLDGKWKNIVVDNFLPVNAKGQLAFAKSSKNQLWVSLIEKAYAKCHNSYSAISGGFVSEAMFDLTGLPCEVIEMESRHFDSEVTWGRLLSFSKEEFPMGCATSYDATLKNVGLVGCHAYSILECVEMQGRPGKQLQIDELFKTSTSKRQKVEEREDSILRLLRIRNPWGKREFTGDWSDKSELWTRKLHAQLGRTKRNDGTFWMSYTDFLCRFSIVEVCKAHKGWYSLQKRMKLGPIFSESVKYFELTVIESTWMYIMLLQQTKRGRVDSYWYSDMNMVLFKVENGKYSLERVCWGGQNKNTYTEILLPHGSFEIAVFSFTQGMQNQTDSDCTLKIFSSNPLTLREVVKEPVQDLALLLQSAIFQEKIFQNCLHVLDEGVILLRIHAQSTAVAFIALNSSPKWSSVNLRLEAKDVKVEFEKGICERSGIGTGTAFTSLEPFSQKILCIMHPHRKMGIFEFTYNWEYFQKAEESSSKRNKPDPIFAFKPLRVTMPELMSNKDRLFTKKGSSCGKAKFLSRNYGSAQ